MWRIVHVEQRGGEASSPLPNDLISTVVCSLRAPGVVLVGAEAPAEPLELVSGDVRALGEAALVARVVLGRRTTAFGRNHLTSPLGGAPLDDGTADGDTLAPAVEGIRVAVGAVVACVGAVDGCLGGRVHDPKAKKGEGGQVLHFLFC